MNKLENHCTSLILSKFNWWKLDVKLNEFGCMSEVTKTSIKRCIEVFCNFQLHWMVQKSRQITTIGLSTTILHASQCFALLISYKWIKKDCSQIKLNFVLEYNDKVSGVFKELFTIFLGGITIIAPICKKVSDFSVSKYTMLFMLLKTEWKIIISILDGLELTMVTPLHCTHPLWKI